MQKSISKKKKQRIKILNVHIEVIKKMKYKIKRILKIITIFRRKSKSKSKKNIKFI